MNIAMRSTRFASTLGVSVVLLIVVLLCLSGINRELNFGYDEAAYLVTAKALASGEGYVQQSLPGSPAQVKYPPLVSGLLSLIWRVFPDFPDNLAIMRMLMLLAGVIFLAVSYRTLREGLALGQIEALSIVALVGFNPLFLSNTTLLSSDILYALLSVASLCFYSRFVSGNKAVHLGLALSFAAVAVLTRTVGIVLFGALVLHLVLRRRFQLSLVAAACAATIFLPWQIWSWATHQAYSGYPIEIAANYRGYFGHLAVTGSVENLPLMLMGNFFNLTRNWAHLLSPWASWDLAAVVVVWPVILHRLSRSIRREPLIIDVYCALYLLVILLWPWPHNSRFLLVVSPFLIYYVFDATKALINVIAKGWSDQTAHKAARFIVVVLAVSMLLHAFEYSLVRRSVKNDHEVVKLEFYRMLDWIKHNTPRDAVVIGALDPVYYLLAKRKAVRISYPDPFAVYYMNKVADRFPQAGKLLEWFKEVKACYVIQDPMIGEPRQIYYYFSLIQALRAASPSSLKPVYLRGNGWFMVYKIADCPRSLAG